MITAARTLSTAMPHHRRHRPIRITVRVTGARLNTASAMATGVDHDVTATSWSAELPKDLADPTRPG